jgi:hypothetical protein
MYRSIHVDLEVGVYTCAGVDTDGNIGIFEDVNADKEVGIYIDIGTDVNVYLSAGVIDVGIDYV